MKRKLEVGVIKKDDINENVIAVGINTVSILFRDDSDIPRYMENKSLNMRLLECCNTILALNKNT